MNTPFTPQRTTQLPIPNPNKNQVNPANDFFSNVNLSSNTLSKSKKVSFAPEPSTVHPTNRTKRPQAVHIAKQTTETDTVHPHSTAVISAQPMLPSKPQLKPMKTHAALVDTYPHFNNKTLFFSYPISSPVPLPHPPLSHSHPHPNKPKKLTTNSGRFGTLTPYTWTRTCHAFCWPPPEPIILSAIAALLDWLPMPALPIPFNFELSAEAAQHNIDILRNNNFDLHSIMLNDTNSPLHPGSEFRPVHLLDRLFKGHPRWSSVRKMLTLGAHFPLDPLTEETRLHDLKLAKSYGNHKSAKSCATSIMTTLAEEISRGWQLPIPLSAVDQIPGAVLGPIGAAHQHTLDNNGNPHTKERMTHDQTFSFTPGSSVNARTQQKNLPHLQYGHCLSRIIHYILALRWRFPWAPIFLSKSDYKSAYRKLQTSGITALQSMMATGDLTDDPNLQVALICLRLSFGGSACPALFSDLSEMATDLANALAQCQAWDPFECRTPYDHLVGEPLLFQWEIPITPAKPLRVDPGANENTHTDVFLDDMISITPCTSARSMQMASKILPFIMTIMGRPNTTQESLPRELLMSLSKAKSEATPTEQQTVLGWTIDTRRLRISLPPDKHSLWHRDVGNLLANPTKSWTYKILSSMVGRLQHLSGAIPVASHFLSRLRDAQYRAEKFTQTRLSVAELDDLRLFKDIINTAARGIDLNLLSLRAPTEFGRTDACETGLGGYSLTSGTAWRFQIPPDLLKVLHINYLEFLACVTHIVVLIYREEIPPGTCIRTESDNCSAVAWMEKTNFLPNDKTSAASFHLARFLARLALEHNVCFFTNWIEGTSNSVADALSRSFPTKHSPENTPTTYQGKIPCPDPIASYIASNVQDSDTSLTSSILSSFSSQVSPAFTINPLPQEISSAVQSMMSSDSAGEELLKVLRTKRTHTGNFGSGTSMTSTLPPTTSWTTWTDQHSKSSSAPSWFDTAKGNSPIPPAEIATSLAPLALPQLDRWRRVSLPQDDPTHA